MLDNLVTNSYKFTTTFTKCMNFFQHSFHRLTLLDTGCHHFVPKHKFPQCLYMVRIKVHSTQ